MSEPLKPRILVTGGTGFIGRNVVNRLLADGFSPLVTTFDQAPRTDLSLLHDIQKLDLTDTEQVIELIQNYRPSIVLHFAGVTGNADATGNIYDSINFSGTVNLLNALEKTAPDRVIMLGTAAEYGGQAIPFREDMPARPVSPYAVSKARANEFALSMHRRSGLPVTILRVFTAYGYGQPGKMFLPQAIRHAILKRHFKMSDGLQKRDFVYVDDVVEAILAAMVNAKTVGKVINIGGGKGIPLKDVARKVWELCGTDLDLLDVGARGRSGDDMFDTEADISLAKEILNWRPGPNIMSEEDSFSRLKKTIEQIKHSVDLSTR